MLNPELARWNDDRGLAESLEQGIEQGRRAVLGKMLGLKFGVLSDESQARLSSASPEQLDSWLARSVHANSLEELFGESS